MVLRKILIVAAISLGLGVLAFVPVVESDNGYVAGFIFLPMLVLVGVSMLFLFILGIALISVRKEAGLFFLLASLLVPCGFFGAAVVSKRLEIGTYYQEPMSPIVSAVANKVVFKKDATHDEVQKFWSDVLSEGVSESGTRTRPGVQGISSNSPENGHEVVTFAFFANATDEQKSDIRERIMAYPPVHQYLENVDTSIITTEAESPPLARPVDGNRIPKRKPARFEYQQ